MTEEQKELTQDVNFPQSPKWKHIHTDTIGVLSIDINDENKDENTTADSNQLQANILQRSHVNRNSTQHEPTESQFNAIKWECGSPLPCYCAWIPCLSDCSFDIIYVLYFVD